MRSLLPIARRFLVIAAISFWLGGFTFYSGVAIPVGVQVLGNHRRIGFITQHVTNWLNVAGVCALAILLWNLAAVWNNRGKLLRYTLLASWLLMAAIEIELIALHPFLDKLIGIVMVDGTPVRTIFHEEPFELLHHFYLMSTSVQWLLGMIHVLCICIAWEPLRAVA